MMDGPKAIHHNLATMIEKKGDAYSVFGKETNLEDLLCEVIRVDDEKKGSLVLADEDAERLSLLFSSYVNVPSFRNLSFMEGSRALFSYLAKTHDEAVAKLVADNMGLITSEEQKEKIRKSGKQSSSYKTYWSTLAREVLTYEGFDDYRFGAVKMDSNGCYLYDDERAVCYVEVSREGDEKRDAIISLTLLGNPEAIAGEDDQRAFEWCCFFDDELAEKGKEATILGGKLRTIDPFGPHSLIHRRYDIMFEKVGASELGLILRSLVHLMDSYPPQEQ